MKKTKKETWGAQDDFESLFGFALNATKEGMKPQRVPPPAPMHYVAAGNKRGYTYSVRFSFDPEVVAGMENAVGIESLSEKLEVRTHWLLDGFHGVPVLEQQESLVGSL
jgi:hypothetical protein